jgi:hypothetical protein
MAILSSCLHSNCVIKLSFACWLHFLILSINKVTIGSLRAEIGNQASYNTKRGASHSTVTIDYIDGVWYRGSTLELVW